MPMKADTWWGGDLPTELVDPDARWQELGVDTIHDLEKEASRWTVDPRVPAGKAKLLAVARSLFCHSYFTYEYLLVSTVWGLFSLEAGLRDVLGASEKRNLVELVDEAHRRGLVSDGQREMLHFARQFRNKLAHPKEQQAFTVGVSAPILEMIHDVVGQIYRGGEAEPPDGSNGGAV
ncbi:MAG TPA: hypothetical protein VEU29_07585 [Actinomycetota bacterium]|nr:hypothetical protein [Actinomycetota bacterium]